MKIDEIYSLLEKFKEIPKDYSAPTFLEISHYPKRRFEEICSRILSFYFNPTKEHNLKDLFLSSLLELLKEKIRYRNSEIKVITEDNADGKRIDLVIYSPDFIIGIENKITASLYNPLNAYKKRLEEYSINNTLKIVLSLKKITDENEKSLIKNNGFKAITYFDFFEVIKRNIGNYIYNCNQKYLTHLFDFIKTLENMTYSNNNNKRLSDFFYNNSKDIEELIKLYNKHREYILSIQKEKISEIQKIVSEKTNVKWWAWQGWDLGYNASNKNKPTIGIEASFKETKDNPLGKFHIDFTTWELKDWAFYEQELTKKFPKNSLEKENNRVFFHMDIIDGNQTDIIIEKLSEYFSILKDLTE